MARQIPNYLRLHSAEDNLHKPRRSTGPDRVGDFWRTFAETTGWALEKNASAQAKQPKLRSMVGVSALMSSGDLDDSPTISESAALELATSAYDLARQLTEAEDTIRLYEARLAAVEASNFAGSSVDDSGKAEPLADRISSILESGVAAIDCNAAALYLLDDQTSTLKMRASFGLPTSRLTGPSRKLQGSLADLEALVGSVVTVDDCVSMPQWGSPEDFGAAMCVAIHVSGTPIGTLWFWSTAPRTFAKAAQAAARLVSGLVASELTSDTLAHRTSKAMKAVKPLRSAASWQQRQQPIDQSPAEGWSMSGWTEAPLALASSWFYWDILPDGMLAMIIAEAHGEGYESAMVAATARAAWQAHCGYRHDPSQMLRRISDTMWQTNTGDQLLSCFYAQLNPETGEGSMAAAGNISGIIMGRYGFRPLVEQTQPVGMNIDLRPRLHNLQMDNTESLFAYTPGLIERSSSDAAGQFLNQHRLVELIRDVRPSDLTSRLAAIRRAAAKCGKPARDRTILAVSRK